MNAWVVLQKKRKQLGLTQCQVAEGICTQGLISMIEAGKTIPTADILFAISKRLKLPLEECFHPWAEELEHVQWLRSELKRCARYRCFEELSKYLYEAKKNSFFQEGEALSFLLWHESLYIFFEKRDREKAIELIERASEVMPFLDHLRFAELQNTRGIYYADRGELKMAITIFLQGLDVWENHNFSSERTLDIRIRYNVSKAYFKIKEYNKAILHCDRAIERCVEEDTLCIYADLHYLRGQILYDCGAWEESFQMFTLAKTMFETSKQTQFLEITQKKMRELFSAPTKNQSVKMEIWHQ